MVSRNPTRRPPARPAMTATVFFCASGPARDRWPRL